jgi:hypothetical protein
MGAKRAIIRAAALLMLVRVDRAGAAAGQEPPLASPPYRAELVLQKASGFPGGQVTVPVELRLADRESVAAIQFAIRAPEGTSFQSVAAAYVLQALNAAVTAAPAAASGSGGTFTVRFTTQDPMPAGVIGFVVFDVPADTTLGQRHVVLADVTMKSVGGAAVVPLNAVPADVEIIDPKSVPMTACFLYMH